MYGYVGTREVLEAVQGAPEGAAIHARDDLQRWADAQDDWQGDALTATFVVMPDGTLRVAPQRSEHVACAGGGQVLAAGELVVCLHPGLAVVSVTNQSTGYCPEPDCWESVRAALAAAGVPAPAALSEAFVFRRCPTCGERNLVKEGWFECACCGAELPQTWNFATEP